MNNDFFEALEMFEKEKGIEKGYLTEKIQIAIVAAVKKGYDVEDNVIVEVDGEKGKIYVAIKKLVVEEVEMPETEMLVDEARNYSSKANVGDFVEIPLEPKEFGRIAAQAAKQIIRQGIREAERSQMYKELQKKENEIVSAVVLKIDQRTGNLTLDMGKYQSLLPKAEQVENETFKDGEHIKVYVVGVNAGEKGPKLMISRTNAGLVKRLFEMEVPEIFEGIVEIKAISREAGTRTKMAVYSKDENVDPSGACIGPKGIRVAKIVDELKGEKIDIIKYNEDPAEFIKEALAPAKVLSVEILDLEEKTCRATVPDNQLSLAIGNKGKNAKLAARLTGWKIDIKPESGIVEKPAN